jgi:hypothetical protein
VPTEGIVGNKWYCRKRNYQHFTMTGLGES